jgi:hypothetical protein
MTYMQDLEIDLKKMLVAFANGELSTDDLIKSVKHIVYESYKHGQKAGPQPAPETAHKEITNTSRPSTEKRSGQAPFQKKYYKR